LNAPDPKRRRRRWPALALVFITLLALGTVVMNRSWMAPWCNDVAQITGASTLVPGATSSKQPPSPERSAALDDYVHAHADVTGGWWSDGNNSGTVVVAFTDDPASHSAELAAIQPRPVTNAPPTTTIGTTATAPPTTDPGIRINGVHVTFTEQELRAIQADASRSVPDIAGAGVEVMRNRAYLSLNHDTGWTDRLRLGRQFGATRICVNPGGPVTAL
jgi:hypothetical protein